MKRIFQHRHKSDLTQASKDEDTTTSTASNESSNGISQANHNDPDFLSSRGPFGMRVVADPADPNVELEYSIPSRHSVYSY